MNATDSIIERYETLNRKLLEPPKSVEELVQLQKFVKESRITEIKALDDDVENAKKRYVCVFGTLTQDKIASVDWTLW